MREMLYGWQLQIGDIFIDEGIRYMMIGHEQNGRIERYVLNMSTALTEWYSLYQHRIVEKVSTTH